MANDTAASGGVTSDSSMSKDDAAFLAESLKNLESTKQSLKSLQAIAPNDPDTKLVASMLSDMEKHYYSAQQLALNGGIGNNLAKQNTPDGGNGGDTPPPLPPANTTPVSDSPMLSPEKLAEQQNTIASLQAIFAGYGLQSLYGKIQQYVKDGYSGDTVSLMLRDTDEYKQRFPAMSALAAKGRAISEASYIDYERTAAQFEKQYGLPSGMLSGNVTSLLSNDVSAAELLDRVQLASANSLMAPPELRQTLQNFYGIGQGGLTAYFLDPTVAEPLLQKQAATAQIGAEAMRQGVDLGLDTATQLQQLGVTNQMARQGFQQVAGSNELFSGAGDITSQGEMIQGLLAGDQTALQNVNRAVGARKARFEGNGDYLTAQQGMTGLQSAATT